MLTSPSSVIPGLASLPQHDFSRGIQNTENPGYPIKAFGNDENISLRFYTLSVYFFKSPSAHEYREQLSDRNSDNGERTGCSSFPDPVP
jgi:hypothetical protein